MRVRKLEPIAPTPPPPTGPPPPSPPPSSDEAVTGALFNRATDVLAFVAAVSGARIAESIACQYDANGRWWIEVPCPSRQVAPLVVTARGRPYVGGPRIWRFARSDGQEHPGAVAPTEARVTTLVDGAQVEPLTHWWGADLRDLMAEVQLPRASLVAAPEVWVFAPAALARVLALRALGLGLSAELAPADHRDVRGETPPRGVMIVRVRGTSVPRAWQQSAADLPEVIVAAPFGERLLVEVRTRLVLGQTLAAGMVPEGERWLLGASEGARQVTLLGAFAPAAPLLVAPAPEPRRRAAAPNTLPQPGPLRVIRTDDTRAPIAAVWLDAEQLGWLATWLMGHPLAEQAFVLPAGDHAVLLGSRALLSGTPFGVPLTRIGPGALLLRRGLGICPPLSPAARVAVFGELEDHVLVLTEDGNTRAPLAEIVPAWTLWAGDPPAVTTATTGAAHQRLLAFARAWGSAAKQPEPVPPGESTDVEREQLRRAAATAELRGRWAEAAGLRERARDFHHAARLYERAAAEG